LSANKNVRPRLLAKAATGILGISVRRLEITKFRGSDFAPGEFPLSFGPHGGAPGTSKTTLAGKFAESACRRGEQTLFVSFDEGGERIQRNLTLYLRR
jgi:hypothetical protein